MSELPTDLRADCANCFALCCIALPFDADQGFGFDKPAHTPCKHLDTAHRCAIHPRLADEGFAGCAAFECFGAGQRVSQHLFGGKSWRDAPATAEAMCEAFFQQRALHETMAMLALAETRCNDAVLAARLGAERTRLMAARDAAFDLAALQRPARALLAEFAQTAVPPQRPRAECVVASTTSEASTAVPPRL